MFLSRRVESAEQSIEALVRLLESMIGQASRGIRRSAWHVGLLSLVALVALGPAMAAAGSRSSASVRAAAVATSFANTRSLTFNSTSSGANISGALTDFPICVEVDAASWPSSSERSHFFSASNAGGKRVEFFDSDGSTKLSYEVEKYDAANQDAIYWVKVPQVDGNSSSDKIVLGYGSDPNGSDQDAMTSVWDANFKGVWHFRYSSGISVPDSTSGNHPIALSGTFSWAGDGLALNGGKGSMGPLGVSSVRTAKTLEVFAYIDPATAQADDTLLSDGDGTASDRNYDLAYLRYGGYGRPFLFDMGKGVAPLLLTPAVYDATA